MGQRRASVNAINHELRRILTSSRRHENILVLPWNQQPSPGTPSRSNGSHLLHVVRIADAALFVKRN